MVTVPIPAWARWRRVPVASVSSSSPRGAPSSSTTRRSSIVSPGSGVAATASTRSEADETSRSMAAETVRRMHAAWQAAEHGHTSETGRLTAAMAVQNISTIGLIGAGNIGAQLARLGVQHGYRVVISNSRGPETLGDLVAELGDHATAATAEDAAKAG